MLKAISQTDKVLQKADQLLEIFIKGKRVAHGQIGESFYQNFQYIIFYKINYSIFQYFSAQQKQKIQGKKSL